MCGDTLAYLHLHGELPAVVVGLAVARVVIAVAVRVYDAGLAQVSGRAQRGQVLAAREAAAAELRRVGRVHAVRLGGEQQRGWRLGPATVLVLLLVVRVVLRVLRAVGGQVEQRVLEGEGVAHGGRLLLLLLGQRVGGGAHLAQLRHAQPAGDAGAPRAGRQASPGTELLAQATSAQATAPASAAAAAEATEAAEARERGLGGGVENIPHRL